MKRGMRANPSQPGKGQVTGGQVTGGAGNRRGGAASACLLSHVVIMLDLFFQVRSLTFRTSLLRKSLGTCARVSRVHVRTKEEGSGSAAGSVRLCCLQEWMVPH